MLLPWGKTSVLGQVVAVLNAALQSETDPVFNELIVVTGGAREAVEAEVARLTEHFPVRCIHNPAHQAGEMLSSLQCGLAELGPDVESALIGLGDQPQLSLSAARMVLSAVESSGARLVVPSFQMRRGHPWLVERSLWTELLNLKAPQTLREFLNAHAEEIQYVETDQTILKDLDTPEDYQRERP